MSSLYVQNNAFPCTPPSALPSVSLLHQAKGQESPDLKILIKPLCINYK